MSVRAWQDTITIPTYPIGPEDPNPPFQRQNNSWAVYPYALQDDVLEGHAEPRDYTALHIENEYLHCIVLPQLGGHMYSLLDKVTGREVFYRNNVVKWGLVAVRGAWISGGIEFNFPTGHTPTTVDNVSWEITDDDAEGSITIGNIDRVSRMQWHVRLSLEPGQRRLCEQVILRNRMPYKQRHWFWNNSAVPASDDLHLIYPARKARVSGGIVDYPVTADGRDISWYTAHNHADDIFTLDVREDFFGVHYLESDFGMVHVGDRHDLQGKKYFTWGTAGDGDIWVDLLTDDDGQYVEIQSGRFETQSIWEFLRPYEEVAWEEYWMPENGMDGWVWANEEAVLNFEITDGGIKLGALTTAEYEGAVLAIEHDGSPVWSAELVIGPTRPYQQTIEMPAGCDAASEFALVLSLPEEEWEIIRYEHPPWHQKQPKVAETGESVTPHPTPEDECSVEEFYIKALEHMTRLSHKEARRLFDRALQLDAGSAPAHTGLGMLDYRAGLYESARAHLEQAVARDKFSEEAWHYLGLARWKCGDHGAAENALWEGIRRHGAPGTALQAVWDVQADLGEPEVVDSLDDTPEFITYPSYGLRSLERGVSEPEPDAPGQFAHWCRDDVEMWLEEAFACDPSIAIQTMRLALERCPAAGDYPMTHYSLAYWLSRLGHDEAARESLKHAVQCKLDYCFPSRLEELPVLQWAVEQDATDWKARYLLGNLLAGLDRGPEAMAQWRAAAEIDASYAVLHRNLAYGAESWEDDAQAAVEHYRAAINLNPDDYRYYLQLERLQRDALGMDAAEQLAMFLSAPDAVQSKWQIAARIAELLVALKRFDEALDILQSHQFFPWEGATHMRAIWVNCLTGHAEATSESGDHAAALANLELAMTYPTNLGVGKSAYPNDARLLWSAACEAEAIGDEAKQAEYLEMAAAEPHRHTGETDWWKLLALRKLGRDDQAAEMEKSLREWADKHREDRRQGGVAKSLIERLEALD